MLVRKNKYAYAIGVSWEIRGMLLFFVAKISVKNPFTSHLYIWNKNLWESDKGMPSVGHRILNGDHN